MLITFFPSFTAVQILHNLSVPLHLFIRGRITPSSEQNVGLYGHRSQSVCFLLLPPVFRDGIHIGSSKQNQNFPPLISLHSWKQCTTVFGVVPIRSIITHRLLHERHYKNTKLNYTRYFQGDKLHTRWQHSSVQPTAARKCQHLYSWGKYLISVMGQYWGKARLILLTINITT
jgi:hypothetical protein